MSAYFMAIWYICDQYICKFYGHLVNFVVIWCIFPLFGILLQEKSGNPACNCSRQESTFRDRHILGEIGQIFMHLVRPTYVCILFK
jgi:hypothetical protein